MTAIVAPWCGASSSGYKVGAISASSNGEALPACSIGVWSASVAEPVEARVTLLDVVG